MADRPIPAVRFAGPAARQKQRWTMAAPRTSLQRFLAQVFVLLLLMDQVIHILHRSRCVIVVFFRRASARTSDRG